MPDLYHDAAAMLKTSLDIDRAAEELAAGAAYVKKLPFVRVAIVGFCMGGGLALLAIARSQQFNSGVIYFPSIYPDASELEGISCPLLFHYGTADTVTPRSEIDRIAKILGRANKPYDLQLYEGADHAFVNDMHPEHYSKEATERSWLQTIEFLKRTLKAEGG